MFRVVDSFLFTLERLWQHRMLVLWALVGLGAAATMALSVVLYVDAVNTGLLSSHLEVPPYAFRYRYLGSWNGNITPADVTAGSAAVQVQFAETIGLPLARSVSYERGGVWTVRSKTDTGGEVTLGAFAIGSLNGADDQMTIVAGQWPPEPSEDGVIPVLLAEKMLYSLGVEVGDLFTVTRPGGASFTLQVAALWRPANALDPSWIFTPKFFDEVFLVQPEALALTLEGLERPVEEVAWFLLFDGSQVRTSDVDMLLGRIADGAREVTGALPGIRLDLTPQDELTAFNVEVSRLTQQLILMLLPVAGLVLYFVALVAGLLVSRQQPEDVKLASRGMSRWAILGIHFRMWLVIAGLALVAGVALSPLVVRLVGQTTSFLRFDAENTLTVTYTPQAILAGAVTSLTAASAGLILAWRTSRQSITGYKQTTARASQAWWQRMYLDVILLVPGVYVLYTLWRQGGLATDAEDPFANPLTFLGPTLFALGITLLFLRVWHRLMRTLAGLISYTGSVALLMALRELTRSIGRYRGTLLMMCFTLSLTGFTASMASTLDRSLKDSVDYRIGADVVAITVADAQTEQGETDATTGQTTLNVIGYNTLPIEDLLTIEGVANASRVGRYPARLMVTNQRVDGTVLGVDRAAIAAVTRARDDYSDESLAELFNRLAGNRTGLLISRNTAATYNLRINQEVTYQVQALNQWYELKAPIVGVLDYFPTLDPGRGFFAVTNLDPIFEAVGTQLPHDYWISLESGADPIAVRQEAARLGYPILEWRDPELALKAAQAAPSRRGVLGFLSVGFVASIVLTLVGAVIQTTASFRAQVTQLGSLRAMGMGGGSVSAYLTLVQGLAAASGIASGTSVGVATTILFLPLLDFSGGLPPYLVRVAWGDITLVYLIFAGVLLAVTVVTTIVLGRENLAALVKLGDV